MGLDINTPKGQISKLQEVELNNFLREKWSDFDFRETQKNKPGKFDGFIFNKSGECIAIYEVKCRDASFEQMQKWGSWLITFDKVLEGKAQSEKLPATFYGFLYCTKDREVLCFKIAKDGRLLIPMKIEETVTQATTNGGKAQRLNAFIGIEHAIRLGKIPTP